MWWAGLIKRWKRGDRAGEGGGVEMLGCVVSRSPPSQEQGGEDWGGRGRYPR